MGGGKSPKSPPPVPATPQKSNADIQAEKQRERAQVQARRGRRATIMTPPDYGETAAPGKVTSLGGEIRKTLG
jgi:hypothetical protein